MQDAERLAWIVQAKAHRTDHEEMGKDKNVEETVATSNGTPRKSKQTISRTPTSTYRNLALMWIDTIYLQVSRLEEAVDNMMEYQVAQKFVDDWPSNGRPREWRNEYRRAKRILARQRAMTVGPDKYFFLLAFAQLIKCVRALTEDDLPTLDREGLMRDLRNIEEHWEQENGRSIERVRPSIPDIIPGRLMVNNKHIWFEGADLMELLMWTFAVHHKLRVNAEARGEPIVDHPWHHGLPMGPRALRIVVTTTSPTHRA